MRMADPDHGNKIELNIPRHHSGMQVGFGLKLREAVKKRFEVRSPVAIAPVQEKKGSNPEEECTPNDDSTEDNPFQQLKKSTRIKHTAPSTSTIGYRDECITVDARKNRKNQYVLVKGNDAFDVKDGSKKTSTANSVLDPYCLVVTRRFAMDGELEAIILTIQSPSLIRVIREVVEYYPDNTFRVGDSISCSDPPELIYHHRKELAQYKARPDIDDRTELHVDFLLKFLYTHLADRIAIYEAFLAAGMVNFRQLWMMFKPGTYVFERETEQLYYYRSGSFEVDQCRGPCFNMVCDYVDFDGESLGKANTTISILAFDHQREISALAIIPFDMQPETESIRRSLIERGKRFLDLRGVHVLQHSTKGRVVVDAKTCLKRLLPGNEDKQQSKRRGIVVAEKCECVCPVCRGEVAETPDDYDHDTREISDDLLALCASSVLCFTLGSHQWSQVRIDDLAEVQWSPDAIDRLVLDKRQKKVLSSLVNSSVFTEGVDGDVIGWKGKGLVMLMHGAPGTGKTLTAESVCESLRRPLYIVSGGELGTSPEVLEKKLQETLELSKLWKAVILIDEADVFLEERSAQDIVRNNFVSVFLRRLEYFEGILMLTTNRVEQFDEAFISRIHLAINYPELEPWMRKEIWINALSRLPSERLDADINDGLAEISEVPLNGRVISYAVRTATAIADEDGSKLAIEHLWDVVSVHQKFNEHVQTRRNAKTVA